MQDNFEENKSPEDEGYSYPKKASIPIKFSEDEDKSLDGEDVLEVDMGTKEDSEKRTNKFLTVSVVLLVILVATLVFYIVYSFKNTNAGQQANSSAQGNSAVSDHTPGESEIKFEERPADSRELSAETIYANVSPSVVGVVVYDSKADIISDPISEGSGIIISEKGYIVTNSHVVGNSKQNNIKIVLNTNEEFSGKVVGYDSKTDIAVIKVDKTGLKPATFGNSDEVKVGASALALGNPLGLNFASSLTRGIISAINRCSSTSANSLVKYIQTDAAINPGNSGGPLINMYGDVIGMNSSKIAVAHCEGMGFAIPSNTIKSVVDDIIEKGYVSGRVRLGLSGKMVSNYQAQIYNVPIGIIVSEISSDSNLIAMGVQSGDIITKINDVTITSMDVFYGELYSHKPGESVKLSVYRPSSNRVNFHSFEVNVILLEDKGETQNSEKSSK